MQCVVERDTNRYYAEMDRAEARSEAIDRRALELTQEVEEFYPFDVANFSEAYGELSAVDVAQYCRLIKEGCLMLSGQFIKDKVTAYWLKKAEVQAEKDIDAGDSWH